MKIINEYLKVLMTPTKVFAFKVPIYPAVWIFFTLGIYFVRPERYGSLLNIALSWGIIIIGFSVVEFIFRKATNRLPK